MLNNDNCGFSMFDVIDIIDDIKVFIASVKLVISDSELVNLVTKLHSFDFSALSPNKLYAIVYARTALGTFVLIFSLYLITSV